jgi:hyperosmotically inducible periplasmic protein
MAQANQDVQGAGRSAADSATNAVSDAAITAQVNAQLAKDPNLSAMTIDVDTSGGQVALHGTAPDASSKERATTLAHGVKGVQSVDNQLTVAPKRP